MSSGAPPLVSSSLLSVEPHCLGPTAPPQFQGAASLLNGQLNLLAPLPCRPHQVFPHLTDVARKHKAKGLTVIGITSEPKAQVAGFVQQMGYGMDYVVASDSAGDCQRKLAAPAGVRGIPHAFVVGSDGRIKFSGHPMDPDFTAAVDKAVSETAPKAGPPTLPAVTASREELQAMSIKDLKQILRERGVSIAGLAEKGDIVAKILEECTGGDGGDSGGDGGDRAPSAPTAGQEDKSAKPRNVVCKDGVCRVVKEEVAAGGKGSGRGSSMESNPPPSDGLGRHSDLSTLKVSELKIALKQRGVSMAGLSEKPELVQALQQALQG